jgi:FkbM family methyltransferase
MPEAPHLEKMLQDSAADIRERLRSPYDAVQDSDSKPIVLFGCGPLGQRTSAALLAANRPPAAFADNNSAKWGAIIDGVPVLSPDAAAAAYGKTALFVVTIYNGASVRALLQALGCRYTLHFAALYHALPDVLLPWFDLDDPAKTLAARTDVVDAASLWADDRSRAEYVAQLAWRLGLPTPELPSNDPPSECYFPRDLFTLSKDDLVIDCGAFDGDSLRLLLARNGSLGKFLGLEPDPESFERLSRFVNSLPNKLRNKIAIRQCAVAATTGTLLFEASGSVRSSVSATGNTSVQAVSIDDLLESRQVGLIKMDIEGAELDALIGAKRTLVRDTPVLAISAYHRASDLWTIPRLIKSMVPEYGLYLRRYAEDCWELVCYAVPPCRLDRNELASPCD